jgi:hypothetical protein
MLHIVLQASRLSPLSRRLSFFYTGEADPLYASTGNDWVFPAPPESDLLRYITKNLPQKKLWQYEKIYFWT